MSRYFTRQYIPINFVYVLCVLIGSTPTLLAQYPCLTDTILTPAITVTHPVLPLEPRDQIILPVVVHVIWRTPQENVSDQQIKEQIQRLNLDFTTDVRNFDLIPKEFRSSVGIPSIRFCLAAMDEDGLPTNGITRTQTSVQHIGTLRDERKRQLVHYTTASGHDAWNPDKYINIWIADMDNAFGRSSIGNHIVVKEEDGIVIDPESLHKGFNGIVSGRTLTHEMGHYLGLKHTWGQKSGDCDEDDGIEDTPFQSGPYFDCPTHPQISCGNHAMFMNFMDFVQDNCMHFFTKRQVMVMLQTLTGSRSTLLANTIVCSKPAKEVDLNKINSIYQNNVQRLKLAIPLIPEEPIRFFIVNTTGQMVYHNELFILQDIDIDVNTWPTGIYFVYFRYKKNSKIIKLLKY